MFKDVMKAVLFSVLGGLIFFTFAAGAANLVTLLFYIGI